MCYLENFDLNKSVSLYHVAYTDTAGYGTPTKTRTRYATVNGAAWMAGASEAVLSEQLKNPYSMICIIKPISGVLKTDEVDIDSVTYTIANPDNIMSQNDVMQLNLQP